MKQQAFVLAALATTTGYAAADSADTDAMVRQLQERVASLESELHTAKMSDDEAWLTEQRADEIRGLVYDVLADADTRASLQGSGLTAGYDKNFFIGSADGNNYLKFTGQLQVRFVYNNQDEDSGDSHRWGFENRRTKVKFQGHVVDPTWKFFVNPAFSRSSGTFGLEEAGITKVLDDGWSLTFGQVKAPFNKEELTSSSRQLAVDRSMVNEFFNLDRTQGIQAHWAGDSIRFWAMYNDGARTRNSAWQVMDTEFSGTGRIEFLGAGEWGQFKGFSSNRGKDFGWMAGAGVHYQTGEAGTPAGPEVDRLALTGDLSLVGDGWNAFAAVFYNNLDDDATLDADQYGFVVQGGMFINEQCELFARYEWADLDGNLSSTGLSAGSPEDLSIITVGFNKYINKKVKWTTDFVYGLDELSVSSSGIGLRTDAADEDGQFAVRSQIQLLF